ncbi:MAG: di-heme oxidoredictase family protein [Myxococcota bacterium]
MPALSHRLRPLRTTAVATAIATAIATGGALSLLALGADDPVPWPGGTPPTETALATEITQALAHDDERRRARVLDAWQPGTEAARFCVLQEEIDTGQRELDALLEVGAALFHHEFRTTDGYGSAGMPVPLQRIHTGVRGGLDSFSCAGCHSLGGAYGAGAAPRTVFLLGDGDDIESAVARNPPSLLGSGFVQALAAEMTEDLQRIRANAIEQAMATAQSIEAELVSKGVHFGVLQAHPDGTWDHSSVSGLDPDLVVKPFGWKGEFASLRRMIEHEARVHFGIQSHVLALRHQVQPDPARLGSGPDGADPDDDGVTRELEEGTLTATALHLALLPAPQIIPPHDAELATRWARGSALFDQIGCNECHRRELPLSGPAWEEHPDTTEGPPVTIDLLQDGEPPTAGLRVQLFSDLRRHDMGPALADPHEQPADAIAPGVFVTRPLWGMAESPPYLHDGRAATIPEAILAHGGEALAAQQAFTELPPPSQADLHVFLLSLSTAPRLRVLR